MSHTLSNEEAFIRASFKRNHGSPLPPHRIDHGSKGMGRPSTLPMRRLLQGTFVPASLFDSVSLCKPHPRHHPGCSTLYSSPGVCRSPSSAEAALGRRTTTSTVCACQCDLREVSSGKSSSYYGRGRGCEENLRSKSPSRLIHWLQGQRRVCLQLSLP